MKTLSLLFLSAFLSLSVFANSTLPVLDYYPACDYKIIEKVAVTKRIGIGSERLGQENINKAFLGAKRKLLDIASSSDANGIILTKRKVQLHKKNGIKFKDSKERLLSYDLEGEIITRCKDNVGIARTPAPITSEGIVVSNVNATKIKRSKKEFVLDDLDTNLNRNTATLVTTTLSLDKGAYGVKIDDTKSNIINTFGPPAAELWLQNNVSLARYSHNTWLIFQNDKLIEITNHTRFLNQDLSNAIPFNSKFDADKWAFTTPNGDILSKDMLWQGEMIEEDSKNNEFSLKFENAEHVYKFHITQYLSMQASEKNAVITSFSYYSKKAKAALNKLEAYSNTDVSGLTSLLQSYKQGDEILLSNTRFQPIGIIHLKSKTKLYVLDNNLVAKTYFGKIDKLELYNSIFTDNIDSKNTTQYQSMEFSIGDHANQILDADNQNIQQFGNIIEIENRSYTYNLNLDNDIVYKIEIQLN